MNVLPKIALLAATAAALSAATPSRAASFTNCEGTLRIALMTRIVDLGNYPTQAERLTLDALLAAERAIDRNVKKPTLLTDLAAAKRVTAALVPVLPSDSELATHVDNYLDCIEDDAERFALSLRRAILQLPASEDRDLMEDSADAVVAAISVSGSALLRTDRAKALTAACKAMASLRKKYAKQAALLSGKAPGRALIDGKKVSFSKKWTGSGGRIWIDGDGNVVKVEVVLTLYRKGYFETVSLTRVALLSPDAPPGSCDVDGSGAECIGTYLYEDKDTADQTVSVDCAGAMTINSFDVAAGAISGTFHATFDFSALPDVVVDPGSFNLTGMEVVFCPGGDDCPP